MERMCVSRARGGNFDLQRFSNCKALTQKKKKKMITRCIALSRVFQSDARNTREGF